MSGKKDAKRLEIKAFPLLRAACRRCVDMVSSDKLSAPLPFCALIPMRFMLSLKCMAIAKKFVNTKGIVPWIYNKHSILYTNEAMLSLNSFALFPAKFIYEA